MYLVFKRPCTLQLKQQKKQKFSIYCNEIFAVLCVVCKGLYPHASFSNWIDKLKDKKSLAQRTNIMYIIVDSEFYLRIEN